MGPKIVPSDYSHGNSHPTLYKGNHWDDHFSRLPFLVPFPFLTIPNRDSRWDFELSFKVLNTFRRVYQVGKSTYLVGDR